LKDGGVSGGVIDCGLLVCSELDLVEGERNKRDPIDESNDEAGELKKMGR
jgi:hypothetical protein